MCFYWLYVLCSCRSCSFVLSSSLAVFSSLITFSYFAISYLLVVLCYSFLFFGRFVCAFHKFAWVLLAPISTLLRSLSRRLSEESRSLDALSRLYAICSSFFGSASHVLYYPSSFTSTELLATHAAISRCRRVAKLWCAILWIPCTAWIEYSRTPVSEVRPGLSMER